MAAHAARILLLKSFPYFHEEKKKLAKCLAILVEMVGRFTG